MPARSQRSPAAADSCDPHYASVPRLGIEAGAAAVTLTHSAEASALLAAAKKARSDRLSAQRL